VNLNYIQRPPVHCMEIAGTGGTMRWDNSDGLLHLFRMPAQFGTWSAKPPAPEVLQFTPPDGFERNTMFLEQMRHFCAVVRGEAQPACTLKDGRRALEMALAAKRSAAQGKKIDLRGSE
jgi:predicted dehydrogenase